MRPVVEQNHILPATQRFLGLKDVVSRARIQPKQAYQAIQRAARMSRGCSCADLGQSHQRFPCGPAAMPSSRDGERCAAFCMTPMCSFTFRRTAHRQRAGRLYNLLAASMMRRRTICAYTIVNELTETIPRPSEGCEGRLYARRGFSPRHREVRRKNGLR